MPFRMFLFFTVSPFLFLAAIPALTEAKVAAFRLFKMIDKKSPIDPLSDEGRKLESLSGNIELKNVSFSYPTRQEDPIFKVCITW